MIDQRGHRPILPLHRRDNHISLIRAFRVIEVFERRTSSDAREHAAKGVA